MERRDSWGGRAWPCAGSLDGGTSLRRLVVAVAAEEVEAAEGGRAVELVVRLRGSSG